MKLSLPRFGSKGVVGLDIGSSSVKLVEVASKGRSGFELTHLGTTHSGLSASSRGTETGKSARPIVLGVAAAVLILVGAGVYSRLHAPEVSVKSATVEAPAPIQNTKVRLRVTAFPATAKVYVDDELMPSNPSRWFTSSSSCAVSPR